MGQEVVLQSNSNRIIGVGMNRVKIVVFNEHSLGLIDEDRPKVFQPLREFQSKGAPFYVMLEPHLIGVSDRVRLANSQDFEEYNIDLQQYENDPIFEYVWDRSY